MINFDGTHVQRDENSYWLYLGDRLLCEVFFPYDGESREEMIAAGYVLIPYLYEGEEIFIKGNPR